MSTIVKFNNKVLRLNNKTVGWTAPYYVMTNGVNGTVIATPNTGYNGDTITLSNIPDEGYAFNSYSLTGATLYDTNKFDINNSNVNVIGNFIKYDPYNPLDLPPKTIRVRTTDGKVPFKGNSTNYTSASLVPGTTDVYDVYVSYINFYNAFNGSKNINEVLGANATDINRMESMFYGCSSLKSVALFDTRSVISMNSIFLGCSALTSVPSFDTSNVTNMKYMFHRCPSLTTVPLFNTSNVTSMEFMFQACTSLKSAPLFDTSNVSSTLQMFYGCSSLSSVPLYNTSKLKNMSNMFNNCVNVQSGALALYQQASTQTTPPTSHASTFYKCGSNTTQGAAELAQIPSDWK